MNLLFFRDSITSFILSRLDPQVAGCYHSLHEAVFGTNPVSAETLNKLRDDAELGYRRYHLRYFFLNPICVFREFLPKLASPDRLSYFLRLSLRISRRPPENRNSCAAAGIGSLAGIGYEKMPVPAIQSTQDIRQQSE